MSPASSSADQAMPAAAAAAGAKRIEFDDPHAGIGGLQEAEVSRVRTLRGGWRWALIVATAVTILLCINQQFSLRFFIGYTQLNTEYFYLLIALMLPFTFLIFPNSEKSPLDRVPWYDIAVFRPDLRLRHRADASASARPRRPAGNSAAHRTP